MLKLRSIPLTYASRQEIQTTNLIDILLFLPFTKEFSENLCIL